MINKIKAIKRCMLPCVLSATLASTIVTPVNAQQNETYNPVRDLQFTSELNTDESHISTASEESIELKSDVKDKDNTLTTQNIDFQALDIVSVQSDEQQEEETNIADSPAGEVNSRTVNSTVQTSHDSKSLGVSYTGTDSYVWSIPSEINLNNQDTLTVSATKANEEANASLKIVVSSENGFNMKSDTGRMGAYKITKDGNQITNNSTILETTSSGTSTADLKFTANPANFMTAEKYNDTLTFKARNGYATGTILEIEGMKFIVMSQTGDDTYMLIDGESIGNIQYQPNQNANGDYEIGAYDTPNDKRFDGQYSNTYEGSYIDNYLENAWYKQLPDKLQQAILETEIKQKSINCDKTNNRWMSLSSTTSPASPDGITDWYYNSGTKENPNLIRWNKVVLPDNETGVWQYDGLQTFDLGYNGQSYNTIKRHVYLPSINEIAELVNLNSANKVYDFLKGTNNQLEFMWLRDSAHYTPTNSAYLHYKIRSFNTYIVTDTTMGVRPAFVIDLSKVNATVVDTVKYK